MADQKQEEELLILWDESENDFDFSIDEETKKENSLSESSNPPELISFWDELILEEDNKKSTDSKESDLSDFSFWEEKESDELVLEEEKSENDDLTFLDEDSITENDVLDNQSTQLEDNIVIEDNSLENSESLVDLSQSITESNLEESEKSSLVEEVSVWSMVDILSEAISKAQKRESILSGDISLWEEKISDLKSQISDLESMISKEEANLWDLKNEKKSISTNIESLEKMKTVNV